MHRFAPLLLYAALAASSFMIVSASAAERRLYLFAPSADDARLATQLRIVEAEQGGFDERDFSVVAVTGPGGQRTAFGVAESDFAVVLVGKDGGEKQRWSAPVAAAEVFGLVDAMPMRQREMRERKG